MDMEIKMNQWFRSNEFIQEQFLFEKAVLDRIVSNCVNISHMNLKECIRKYQNIRKSFRKEIHQYFDQQQSELAQKMKQKCRGSDNLGECLMSVEQMNIDGQLEYFKQKRRQLTQSLLL